MPPLQSERSSVASTDDPREVLKACVEFQKSFPRSTQRQLFRNIFSQKSSLYPSERDTNFISDDLLEINWQNAAVSKKNNASVNTPSNIMTDRVDDGLSGMKIDQNNFENESRRISCTSMENASIAASIAAFHPLELDSAVQAEPIYKRGNNASVNIPSNIMTNANENRRISCISVENTSVAASIAATAATTTSILDCGTFHPLELESAVQAEPIYKRGNNASVNIPSNIMTNANANRRISCISVENASVAASIAATAATTTSILDCGTFHPLELESAVQAEAIHQRGNAHDRQEIENHDDHYQEPIMDADCHEAVAESQYHNSGNVVSVCGHCDEQEITTEATVIEHGDSEKATICAWSGETTEAVVMTQVNGNNRSESIKDLDSACSQFQVDDNFNAEYQQQRLNGDSSLDIENNMTAIVVNYNSHHLDATDQSVRAEYMGSASTNTLVMDELDRHARNGFVESSSESREVEQAAVATVLDSGPLDKATVAAWSGVAEAHILEGSWNGIVDIIKDDEGQGASSSTVSCSRNRRARTSAQLEIIGIAENRHPAELESEPSTTAELISTNPNETYNQAVSYAMTSAEIQTFDEPNLQDVQNAKQTSNMMEIISGKKDFEISSFPSRELLPSSMTYNETHESWVVTITSLDTQNETESLRSVRSFSVPTKEHGLCIKRSWSPPKMQPFEFNTECFVCKVQFYPNKPCHCRNCGLCICNSCAVQWPSKMLPETFNTGNGDFVNVCKGCDWLCSAFRRALQEGDSDKAIELYATGNVNLTTPFANIKGEVFFPIHCAVEGRSLSLLRWLIDDNCCPLHVDNGAKRIKNDTSRFTPILTSKSRGLLHIALSNNSIDIMRYLVVEKGMILGNEKDLPVDKLVENFDWILRILPPETDD
eukprot:jgi/Psemu1/282276/fgenesh1_pg.5_\